VNFAYESALRRFSQVTFWHCKFFWRKNIGAKGTLKTLMKLTPGGSNHADHVAAVSPSGFFGVMVMIVVSAMMMSVVKGGGQTG